MVYRQQLEKSKVEATIKMSPEEYKEAILEYLVRYKMLPEGVDIASVRISDYDSTGSSRIRPTVTYVKEVLKLFSEDNK